MILNTHNPDLNNVVVKFHNKNDAIFVNQYLIELQKAKIQTLNHSGYDIGLLSNVQINQLAVLYQKAFERIYFMKSDIMSADLITDQNTSLLDSLGGALLGGGLGMISSKINPNTTYSIILSTNLHGTISINSKNLATATSIFKALGCEKFLTNQDKIIEGTPPTLKDRLKEIEELKNEGIISQEEYEVKRKQIIEKY